MLTRSKSLISVLILSFLSLTKTSNFTMKVGILLMTNSTFPVDMPRVGPAIDMGILEVKRRYGIELEPVMRNYSVWCYKARYMAPGYLADLYYHSNVTAFLGPGCSYAVQSAGRLAEYLRVPMITGLGDLAGRNPAEKDMFETTVILSYNIRKLSVSVRALMNEYQWQHVSIIYDEDEIFYLIAGPSMVTDFENDPSFPMSHRVPFKRKQPSWNPTQTLKDASNHARVFVVLVNAAEFRLLMYHAGKLGMADGDYVFIAVQLAEVDWWGSYRNILKGDHMDAILKKSYESVLILSLQNPVANNTHFQAELKMRALRDYSYEFGTDEPVHYFLTAFYEAVLYLGAAINKTLAEGGDVTDGYSLARTFFGQSFDGLDQRVALDESGTRTADFQVMDLIDADREIFQTVGVFLGSQRNYIASGNTSIRWLKGVPPDMPACGYRGEYCIVETLSDQAIAGIVGGCVVLILVTIIIAQNVYSRRRAQVDVRWRVFWKDIELVKVTGSMASGFSKSRVSTKLTDGQSQFEGQSEILQMFGTTGLYKGTNVYIRRYNIQHLDLNAKTTQELRQMYQLRHGNLMMFIGACVDVGNIAVLTEVCPRGSLMDIIANEGIELDWAFRHSLINDIVQGMRYLHHSDLRFHGSLRSSNCVVDSRFMLKIKGFGPKSFIELEQKSRKNTQLNPYKLLWTAPELLRLPCWNPGTQKGDVYSFAIILYELIFRGEPFELCDLNSQDIIDRIKAGEDPPFRPQIPYAECSPELVQAMKSCWGEVPESRPQFDAIETSLKKVLKSGGSNIMDNLMRRMEQYANNLESLVEDRTKAYMDEKRRAEELLYRMLPVSVAKQLQAGSKVEPETFDGVTIYFSDIVGFTNIAGKSSPMQVVDLLNDLYTIFDATINNFQVYKVETIGDAYMVASGLPIRNGDQHAREISNMALSIRESVHNFKIRHLPEAKLKIRIGLHSGSVVAGVVGLTMPRYCLFGDTVNTASRMESTGEEMKIQVSQCTMALLEMFGSYVTEFRGETAVKGKGMMRTYWLLGNKSISDFTQQTEQIITMDNTVKTPVSIPDTREC